MSWLAAVTPSRGFLRVKGLIDVNTSSGLLSAVMCVYVAFMFASFSFTAKNKNLLAIATDILGSVIVFHSLFELN